MLALVKLSPLTMILTHGGASGFPPFEILGVGTVMSADVGWQDHGYAIMPYEDRGNRPSRFHAAGAVTVAISDGKVIRTQKWVAPVLADVKATLCHEIDAGAGRARAGFITDMPGQQMTYQAKLAEARRWQQTENPVDSDFVLLSFEIGITADTMAGVVDAVLQQNALWEMIGGAIEGMRLGGKKQVMAATTIDAAIAAQSAIVWPTP